MGKKLALFIMVVISLVAAAMPIVHGGSLFEEPQEWFHKTTSSLAKEKVTKLRFYFHVTVIGNNITNMLVAKSEITNKPPGYFGGIQMTDNPLTLGPELTSELMGRSQGLSCTASMQELSLIMIMNFGFTHGKYKGSTLSIFGRNVIALPLREMPIVGGTGVFRLARGIVTVKTVSYTPTTGNAVLEINAFAVHY